MKKLLLTLIITINIVFAQEDCIFDMLTPIFAPDFPYGTTEETNDYESPWIIKWNDNKIQGEPIYINNMNTSESIPFEIYDETDQFASLLQSSVSQWNSNYSLQMEINTLNDNIDIKFNNNMDLFETSTGIASGITLIPVEQSIFDGYKFYEYNYNSIIGDPEGYRVTEGIIYFNSAYDKDFLWTTSTTPRFDEYMLGTVLLHELGHVLSMGHSTYTLTMPPRIMDRSYNPATVTPYLTECDIYNANKHSETLYDIIVGIKNEIAITNYPLEIAENQQYSLNANFYKADPYSTDHVLSWNWIINLYHQSGKY